MIGKFEELALLALFRAGPRSHAAKVYEMFDGKLTKVPAFAALYTSLDRMAKKGMISEETDPADPRSKRLFTITGEGKRALQESLSATRAMGGFDVEGAVHV